MPREIIVCQIGQCGIQLGTRFWEVAFQEHKMFNTNGIYDESISSFFRNDPVTHAGSSQAGAVDSKHHALSTGSTAAHATSYNPKWGRGGGDAADAKSAKSKSGSGLAVSAHHRQPSAFGASTASYGTGGSLPNGLGEPIGTLKARSVCVDMENGVLSSLMRSPLAGFFDATQFIKDSKGAASGSGNNWAVGQAHARDHEPQIIETIRRVVEQCDSLQSFFLLHSMGGGTGSGLGTGMLEMLSMEYPDVYRFTCAVFPSDSDKGNARRSVTDTAATTSGGGSDVVTAPYNAIFALGELIQYADAVLPIDNQALIDMCDKVMPASDNAARGKATVQSNKPSIALTAKSGGGGSGGGGDAKSAPKSGSGKLDPTATTTNAFDHMNTCAAHVLTNLTASMRFDGELNVDLNEITMNLVPYPRMHFLLSSVSPLPLPLYSAAAASRKHTHTTHTAPRSIDQMFSDSFHGDYQLMKVEPRAHRYLACGLLSRGNLQISDLARNVTRIKPGLDMIGWNSDGFKLGLCRAPPLYQPASVLGLSNNVVIADTFQRLYDRFSSMYQRRAYLHHYTNHIPAGDITTLVESVVSVIADYQSCASNAAKPKSKPTKPSTAASLAAAVSPPTTKTLASNAAGSPVPATAKVAAGSGAAAAARIVSAATPRIHIEW